MGSKLDISAILLAMVAIQDAAQDVKKVMADGKISLADIGVVFDLMGQFGDFNAAIAGSKDIVAEIKDLDAAEAQQIMDKINEIVAIFRA